MNRQELVLGINQRLPEWARYTGYGTRALAGYAYAVFMAVLTVVLWSSGATVWATIAAVLVIVAVLLGNYYKTAAELRVECSHCGEKVHGSNICPRCQKRTYARTESDNE